MGARVTLRTLQTFQLAVRLPDLGITWGTWQISFPSRPEILIQGLTKGSEFENLCSDSHCFRRPGWPRFGGPGC